MPLQRLQNLHPGWIASLIAAAVVLWMASGMIGDEASGSAQAGTEASRPEPGPSGPASSEPRMEVTVTISHARTITRTAKLAGRTAAVRKVQLRARIAGKVVELGARRGDYVHEGEVIVRLSAGNLQAELAHAQAMVAQRELEYQAAKRMASKGYKSQVAVATARARLQAARAQLSRVRSHLDYTTIEAPFSGILEKLPVEVGDYVRVGDVVGQVIQQDPFIVWGRVSEEVVAELEVGQRGWVTLVSGTRLHGTVSFISSVADPSTRTYRVELTVDNPDDGQRLIAGASAELWLPLEKVQAHRVEPSILTLNAQGVFGIKSVTKAGQVRFHNARIVRNRNGHIWLTGLPDTLRIISLGQGFVRPGDQVAYTLAHETHKRVADQQASPERKRSES